MKRNLIETYADSVIWKNIDVDWIHNSQCTDLIKHYTKDVMKIELWTFGWSAKSWFANKSNTFNSDWIKIVNNPQDKDQVPSLWDIIFWDWWKYSQYGHVGIVYKAFKWEDRILVLDQNNGNWSWVGSINACKIQEYSYSNIVGWYRHKKFIFDYKWVPVFQKDVNSVNKDIRWMYNPTTKSITLYNKFFEFKEKYWTIEKQIEARLQHEFSHYIWFEKIPKRHKTAFTHISLFDDKVKNNPKNKKTIEYSENAFIKDVCKQFVTEDFSYIWEEYIVNPNKVYWNYLDYKKQAVISLMQIYGL